MKRTIILLSVGLAGLLTSLVAHFPASHAITMMAPPGVTAEGVRGSIWRGNARRIELGGPAPLTAVTWNISATSLVRGRLGLESGFDIASGQATVTATVIPRGDITVTDATFRGPAAALVPLLRLPIPPVSVDGDVVARVGGARWTGGRLEDVAARILWEPARVQEPVSVTLGSVTAEARSSSDGSLRIDVDNRSGSLTVEGTGSMDQNGRYELTVYLRPQPDAPDDVRELLGTYTERANGDFVVRSRGRLSF